MNIPPFFIPIIVGMLAQALKPVLNKKWIQEHVNGRYGRPKYGGMPSAHSAFATSLATIVSLTAGLNSAAFAISIALLILVLDDALRLRIFLERFGVTIGKLVKLLPPESQAEVPPIEQRIGHSISEVMVGALLGIGVTIMLWSLG